MGYLLFVVIVALVSFVAGMFVQAKNNIIKY